MNFIACNSQQIITTTASFPQAVHLSAAEMAELSKTSRWMQRGWWAGGFVLLGYMLWVGFGKTQTLNFSLMTTDEQSEWMLCGLAAAVVAAIYTNIAFFSIKAYRQDIHQGKKFIGEIEVVGKNASQDHDGSATWEVSFIWLADLTREVVEVEDLRLYKQLEIGKKAYLELLPHSKQILSFRKL